MHRRTRSILATLIAMGAQAAVLAHAADATYPSPLVTPATDDVLFAGGAPTAVTSGQVKIGGGQMVVASQVGVGGLPYTGTRLNIAASSAANNFLAFSDSATGGQAWLLGPGVGTGSPAAFSLYNASNSSTLMTVNTAGNVGIGTKTPDVKLQVANPVTIETIATQDVLKLANTYSNYSYPQAASFALGSYAVNSGANSWGPSSRLDIKLKSVKDFTYGATTTVMTLQDNGNVGIGTTTPSNVLQLVSGTNAGGRFDISTVNGATGAANLVLANANTTANNASGIEFVNGGGGPAAWISAINYNHNINGSTTGGLDFSVYNAGTLSHALEIAPSGKIGIGTTTPANLLTISGSSPGSSGALSVSRTDIAGAPPAASGATDANQIAGFGNPAVTFRMGLYNNGDVWMLPSYAGDYSVNLNTVLNPSGGSVGVGIQPTNSRGALQVAYHGAPGGQPTHAGSTDPNQFCALGNINVALRMGDYLNGDVWLQPSLIGDYSSDKNLVLNPNNGNVVIGTGTATATNKLTVFGTISTKEVKVTTTGADYVFADGYALRPLAEVEAFVTRERHLPGVMTAQEMGESGMPVAQVVTAQLAKIEELTLYAIQQQKRIDDLTAQQKARDQAFAAVLDRLAALEGRDAAAK